MTDDHEKFRRWLLKKADKPSHAELVFALDVLGLSQAEAAEAAGYSGGRSDDPEDRQRQLQASASRALRTKKIQRLREAFEDYRRHGDAPPVADVRELQAGLTRIARSDNQNAAIAASKVLLDSARRGTSQDREDRRLRAMVDAACLYPDPMMNVYGCASGLFWRKVRGMGFDDWQAPEQVHEIEQYLTVGRMRPVDVLRFMIAANEVRA